MEPPSPGLIGFVSLDNVSHVASLVRIHRSDPEYLLSRINCYLPAVKLRCRYFLQQLPLVDYCNISTSALSSDFAVSTARQIPSFPL